MAKTFPARILTDQQDTEDDSNDERHCKTRSRLARSLFYCVTNNEHRRLIQAFHFSFLFFFRNSHHRSALAIRSIDTIRRSPLRKTRFFNDLPQDYIASPPTPATPLSLDPTKSRSSGGPKQPKGETKHILIFLPVL